MGKYFAGSRQWTDHHETGAIISVETCIFIYPLAISIMSYASQHCNIPLEPVGGGLVKEAASARSAAMRACARVTRIRKPKVASKSTALP